MFRPDIGTTINYQPYVSSRPWHSNQPYVSSKTLAQQSTINRMFRTDIGTTINYQSYVLSKTLVQQSTISRIVCRPRPWHNNQLSTLCFVQNWHNNYLSTVCFVQTLAQQSTINRMFGPDLGTTINYQPYVSSISWHNNQLSTVCFVQDLGTTINYQPYVSSKTLVQLSTISRIFRRPNLGTTINYQPFVSSRPWYNNQLSTICFVQTLAPQ